MTAFDELKDRFFYRAAVAELFATALFILIIPMVVMQSTHFPRASAIEISVVCGLAIAVIVQTFGPICGAHLNPAVTIAFLIKGDVSALKCVVHILVQLIGGKHTIFIGFVKQIWISRCRGNETCTWSSWKYQRSGKLI